MNDSELAALVANSTYDRPVTKAQTVLKTWDSASKPALLSCANGSEYVVKDGVPGQGLATEHIASELGKLLGAPVPENHLIEVHLDLVQADPFLTQHFQAGVWHGSLWIRNCSERMGLDHVDEGDNRKRFAALNVLYTWIGASDHQFIYHNAPPHSVYSVDHGHFLPNGPSWTKEGLGGAAPLQQMDAFFNPCGLTSEELKESTARLQGISDHKLSMQYAVRWTPGTWEFRNVFRWPVI